MPKLDELIASRLEQKVRVEQANKAADAEKEILDALDAQIIAQLDALGTESAAAHGYSVTLVEEDVPTEVNWDVFIPFIVSNDLMHMLQRRITLGAWREYRDIYGTFPPGTQAFAKKKLSFTKKKSRKKATATK